MSAELDAKVMKVMAGIKFDIGVAVAMLDDREAAKYRNSLDALTLQQAELVRLRVALVALPEYTPIASKGAGGECLVCGGLDPSVPWTGEQIRWGGKGFPKFEALPEDAIGHKPDCELGRLRDRR